MVANLGPATIGNVMGGGIPVDAVQGFVKPRRRRSTPELALRRALR
jgi:formate/nitrite transporter FocA (FNT family)